MFDDDAEVPSRDGAPAPPPTPSPPSAPIGPAPIGCGLAALGLVVGGMSWTMLGSADPLGVRSFEYPGGLDFAQQQAAFEQWRGSARVVLGSAAMTSIPLLASAACGALAVGRRPASPLGALLRVVGVASALCLASEVGTRAIDRTLSTGGSSDIQTPLAMLAFQALCIALAAPLAWATIRPRPRTTPAGDAQ